MANLITVLFLSYFSYAASAVEVEFFLPSDPAIKKLISDTEQEFIWDNVETNRKTVLFIVVSDWDSLKAHDITLKPIDNETDGTAFKASRSVLKWATGKPIADPKVEWNANNGTLVIKGVTPEKASNRLLIFAVVPVTARNEKILSDRNKWGNYFKIQIKEHPNQ